MTYKAKIFTREELRDAVFTYFLSGPNYVTVGPMTDAMADYIYKYYGTETEVENCDES